MADTKVTLKLLIDKKSQQVLFAEAEKKFVDFLFSIFTLPVGTVTRLLQKQNMAGCLHSLYESIENLNDIYIEAGQVKGFLLNPKVAISGATVLPDLLLPSVEQSYTARKIYRCGHCFEYVAHDRGSICPSCAKSMTSELIYVDPPSVVKSYTRSRFYRCAKNRCKHVAINGTTICPSCGNPMPYEQSYVHPPRNIKASSSSEGGYVKGVITYMVMDNLEVKPMSTISSITLLTKLNVKDVRAVEEKVVDFGMDEAVKLLKSSLNSKTVLTDVFLRAETTGTETLISRCKNCVGLIFIRGISIFVAIMCLIFFILENCKLQCRYCRTCCGNIYMHSKHHNWNLKVLAMYY